MADRFQKLFSLENNLYIENAPIIISAAALLNDTESGNIVVQIKLKSVSKKNIKGVKISLHAYDVSGKEINGVEDYQYLDLNIPNGQSFGSNKAVVMPETTTRSFSIKSLTVIFVDSSIWENASPVFVAIPNAKPLNCELENEELVKQYKIETTNKANYIPNTFLNLWTCCCGEINSEEYCANCGTNKNNAFSKYNISDLTEAINLRLDKEKEERLELERKKTEEEKKKKLKKKQTIKKCLLGTTICIGIVLLLFTVKFLFGNMINYTLAEYYASSQKYEDAYKMFLELKDYKDSAQKAEEYKTGEFYETVTIQVGCTLNKTLEYYSPRSENIIVEAKMKVKYYKAVPDYNNVEIVFETQDYEGYSKIWISTYYRYIGEFKNNSITGKGKLYTSNEFFQEASRIAYLVYDGEFLNGMYSGDGKLYDTYKNILRIKATFKDGNVFGEFVNYNDDGSVWNKGTVKNGIMNSEKYGTSDERSDYSPKPDGFDS
ncbi:MAG: hypothetical protein PUF48_00315 [Oscillospiraceae bacterium]|nr:hypothetical protein [Oscillospiraceae bacterium]